MMKIAPLFLVLVLTACGGNDKPPVEKPDPNAPKMIGCQVVTEFPHDTSSYTQGLIVYKGGMYEGTGNYNFSKLKKVDIATGKTLQEIKLDNKYFGEGITILQDTIYQLTWKEKKAFAYTLKDFRKVKEFDVDMEGWGLTTDGKNLIASNGGSDLFYYDPANFKLVKTQTVTENGSPAHDINEMEFINGFIYANQYQQAYILKIDPATGIVVAKTDVTNLWNRIKASDPDADVPNGIAYDADTKKTYI
ncbi:MAG TPA: glutaminyl-peptide cyclotransferase, partial [Chitinophagaceae bacterium]|nr:glutaminyl-peptide cyclotransferase [Chitinophagaceae bacterium]